MRLLYFSNTPLFSVGKEAILKWKWVNTLVDSLKSERPDFEIAVAYKSDVRNITVEQKNGITIYHIPQKRSIKNKLVNLFNYEDNSIVYLKVVSAFNPDIIQVFGTESDFGLIGSKTNIPVVVHVQGLLFAIQDLVDRFRLIGTRSLIINPRLWLRYHYNRRVFKLNALREKVIVKRCDIFLVRSGWDESLLNLIENNKKFYNCDEIIKECFRNTVWSKPIHKGIRITSVITDVVYKGIDIIAKTCEILCANGIHVEWSVFGMNDNALALKTWGLDHICLKKNGVKFKGECDEVAIIEECLVSDIFVHPSYIENSSNAIGEAMCMGLPVVAAFVGGNPTLITNGENGLLFPAGDSYALASCIIKIASLDHLKTEELSQKARKSALNRSDPKKVISQLECLYSEMAKIQ